MSVPRVRYHQYIAGPTKGATIEVPSSNFAFVPLFKFNRDVDDDDWKSTSEWTLSAR